MRTNCSLYLNVNNKQRQTRIVIPVPSLLNKEMIAPVSARRNISPNSATTGAAAVCTLMRLSPEDDVYLCIIKEFLICLISKESEK